MRKRYLQFFADDTAGAMADSSQLATDSAVGADASSPIAQDTGSDESFDSLISGKYKKDYEAKVKSAIDKRFKNQKDFEGKYNSMQPLLMMMADKYGMDASNMADFDIEALTKQVEADNSMYEKEAFERGIDVNTLREQKRLERENRQLLAERDRLAEEEAGRAQYAEIMQMSDGLRQIYPDFDFDSEMQSETFGRVFSSLYSAGDKNAMKTAYEVAHMNEIMGAGMQYATQKTAQNIAASVRSGMNRPSENSMNAGTTAALSETDPRTFKKADFERIKREAEKGKRIILD